jgi:hypothetical protein
MRAQRLAAGIVCLGLAGLAAWWTWANQAYYDRVSSPGRRDVKVADLIAKGPVEGQSVRLTEVELGEPIVIDRGPGEYLDVWFPVYPARAAKRKGLAPGPPQVLFHTRSWLRYPEEVASVRGNANISGTVLNGLPNADIAIAPEVIKAHPNLDAATVWYVSGDRVWQERRIYWTAAMTAAFGILGIALAATGLFGRFVPKKVRETRRRPALRPLDARNVRQASRGYYHAKCGYNTLAAGDDLVRLECPFRGCSGTYCCGCQTSVPLSAVQWEDTGETVADYRERIAAVVPFWRRVWLSWLGNAYEGAINLGLDDHGRVAQPLRDPPGGRVPIGAAEGPMRTRR